MQQSETSKYTVELKEDFIDVLWDGHISKAMAAACNKEIRTAGQQLMNQNAPVLMRVRIANPPLLPNTDAFSEALNTLNAGIPFTRIVAWGKLAGLARALLDVLLESYKTEFEIRYIEDEQQALNWLLHGNASQPK